MSRRVLAGTPHRVGSTSSVVASNLAVTNMDAIGSLGCSWDAPTSGTTPTHYLVEIDPAPALVTWNGSTWINGPEWMRYQWVEADATWTRFWGRTSGTISPAAQISTFADGSTDYRFRVRGYASGTAISTGGTGNDGWSDWSDTENVTYRTSINPQAVRLEMWLPDGTYTGITPGTTLTTSGTFASPVNLTFSTPGQTINAMDYWCGNMDVSGAGVTFNNCRFRYKRGDFANGQGGYCIRTSGSGTVTLNNCQVDGGGAGGGIYGISFGKFTVNESIIHGFGHAAQYAGNDCWTENSQLIDCGIDDGVSPTEHMNAIQSGSGTNLTVINNVLDCIDPTAPLNFQSYSADVTNVTATDNWLWGGAYQNYYKPNVGNPITNCLHARNKYTRSPSSFFGGVSYGTGFFPLGGSANGSQCANDHELLESFLTGSTGNVWWDPKGGTVTGLGSGAS